jgi:hypothetical protein
MTRLIFTAAAAVALTSACSADASQPTRSAAIAPAPRTRLYGKIPIDWLP